jgi:GT2 family glycosyltransferase
METDTTIGIAGPKIYYYDYPGYIQTIGERLSMVKGQTSSIGIGEEDQGQYNKIRDVDYVNVCLLIRTAVIRNIGLIDESYFCYWEDVDYCLRTRKAGYKVIYVPESKIWHKKYMKKKILDKSSEGMISDSVLYYSIRNCFKFMREHANKHQYLVFLFFFLGYYFWHMVADILLFRRDPKRFTVFCSGIKDGLFGKGGSRD